MAGVICERSYKRQRLDESDFYEDSSCASEESQYDWQGYETAWVQDSGDDWSPSSSSESDGDATDVIYEVEYEIASDSTADLDDEESDGSSDIEAALIPIIAAELEEESTTEMESSDDGIIRSSPITAPKSLEDRWKCLRCGVHNVPPMRYCHKCYEIRKGWLDPRPKRRRPKRPRDENGSIDTLPSSSSISSTASSTLGRGDSVVSTQTVDSGISSQSSYEEEQLASCSGAPKQPCSCSSDLCGLCGLRPVDGAFMHGNTGHQLYCYSCSKRVWRERKKCPVCRRTIAKVVKMFKVASS